MSTFKTYALRTVHGRTIEQSARQCRTTLIVRTRQNISFLMLQSQVILQLSSIFQKINLSMTVSPKRDRCVVLKVSCSRYHTVAQISLSCRTSADRSASLGQCSDRLWSYMDSMNSGELLAQYSFSIEQCNRRATVFLNTG